MEWMRFVVCLLLGYLGVHKFMEKKVGMGFLYLFTIGLFGVGWIIDTVRYLIKAIKGVKNKNNLTLIGAVLLLVLVKAATGSSTDGAVEPSSSMNAERTAAATESTSIIEVDPTTAATEVAVSPAAQPTFTITLSPTQEPAVISTHTPTKQPTAAPTENEAEDYILNKNSKIFHETYCSSVKRMKESNKIPFHGTREEAIAKGYDPCKNCRP